MGKTVSAIDAAELPALVLCPASLILNWRREVDMWRPKARREFDVVSYADPGLHLIRPSHYNTVIADEAHFLKNPEARRTRESCRLLHQASKAIAMTGTLVPNRPIELWPLMVSLGITELSYVDFAFRYANAYENEWHELDVRGASRLRELRCLLKPHVIRFTKEQVMPELPPKTWRVIALDLPLAEREKEYSTDDLKRLQTPIPMEALSDVLREHGRRKILPAAEYCRDLLEGGVKKLVVFAHHREVIHGLAGELRDFGVQTVMGGHDRKRKQAAVDLFQTGKARVFVGQLDAAGTGINLTAASHVVFAEASWVPSTIDQAADRCHRIGQRDNVTADLLTIHRSVDEAMLRRTLEKLEVVDQIVPTTDAGGEFAEGMLG